MLLRTARWFLVSGLGFVTGWLLVGYLTARPIKMSLWLGLACATGFAAKSIGSAFCSGVG